MKYVAMLSGGRDSSAMVLKLLEEKAPLDYIIFTDTKEEFPLMYEYIERFDEYIRNKYGMGVTILKTKDTFEDWCFGKITRGERKGMIRGLPPQTSPCYWKRQSKLRPFERFIKDKGEHRIYIGYTYSEKKRASKRDNHNEIYPLIQAKMCEADVDRLLQRHGMENPLYKHFSRTGCAICPYQSLQSLYVLWKHYPKTFKRMNKIEKKLLKMGDKVVNPRWRTDFTLKELKKRFKNEDHWSDVPQKACECSL